MADDKKSFADSIKQTIFNNVGGSNDDEFGEKFAGNIARSAINQVIARAGKGKDELIQILGREIGFAIAAVLKEPLEKLVDSRKIQISLELVEKKETATTNSRDSKTPQKENSPSRHEDHIGQQGKPPSIPKDIVASSPAVSGIVSNKKKRVRKK